MAIAVSQDLVRSQNVAEVLTSRQVRAIRPGQDSADKPANSLPIGSGIKASADTLALLDQQQQQQASYDKPGQQQQKALEAYQQFSNLEKRQQVQQLFSVDLYA